MSQITGIPDLVTDGQKIGDYFNVGTGTTGPLYFVHAPANDGEWKIVAGAWGSGYSFERNDTADTSSPDTSELYDFLNTGTKLGGLTVTPTVSLGGKDAVALEDSTTTTPHGFLDNMGSTSELHSNRLKVTVDLSPTNTHKCLIRASSTAGGYSGVFIDTVDGTIHSEAFVFAPPTWKAFKTDTSITLFIKFPPITSPGSYRIFAAIGPSGPTVMYDATQTGITVVSDFEPDYVFPVSELYNFFSRGVLAALTVEEVESNTGRPVVKAIGTNGYSVFRPANVVPNELSANKAKIAIALDPTATHKMLLRMNVPGAASSLFVDVNTGAIRTSGSLGDPTHTSTITDKKITIVAEFPPTGAGVVGDWEFFPCFGVAGNNAYDAAQSGDTIVEELTFGYVNDHKSPNWGNELTIAAGEITIPAGDNDYPVVYYRLDTENNDASDDLTTINGGFEGQVIRLRTVTSARVTNVKNNGVNIRTSAGGSDILLDSSLDYIELVCREPNQWIVNNLVNLDTSTVQTGAFTAVANKDYPLDATGLAATSDTAVTLPANGKVSFYDQTGTCTATRRWAFTGLFQSQNTTVYIDSAGGRLEFVYRDSIYGWEVR